MSASEHRGGGPPLPPEQYAEHLEELVQLQLEAIAFRDENLDALQARAAELQSELARAREDASAGRAALQREREHLEHLHATRLFRWSAPARRLYGRVRPRGGDTPPR